MSPAPPPAGTGTGKGERKRAELLDSAEELLIASGYAEFSMRSVAAAAGVRLGHLQYYFPARSDLVAAVLERVLGRSLDRLEPLLATAPVEGPAAEPPAGGAPVRAGAVGAPAGASADLVRALLADQDDPALVRLFAEVWALAALDEAVAEAVRGFYRKYGELVATHIACSVPGLDAAACRARAAVFMMLVEGASLFRAGIAAHRTPEADGRLLATALELLTRPEPPPGA
jgi:AcrR family transcriptional regulator